MPEASSTGNDQVVLDVVKAMHGHLQRVGKQLGLNNVALGFAALSDKTKPGCEEKPDPAHFEQARKALKAYGKHLREGNPADQISAIGHMRAAMEGLDPNKVMATAQAVKTINPDAPIAGAKDLSGIVSRAVRTLSKRPSARLEAAVLPAATEKPLSIWEKAMKQRVQEDDKILFELAGKLHRHAGTAGPEGAKEISAAVRILSSKPESDKPVAATRNALVAYSKYLKSGKPDQQQADKQSVVANMRTAMDGLSVLNAHKAIPTPGVAAVHRDLADAVQARSDLESRYVVDAAMAVSRAPGSPFKHPSDVVDLYADGQDKRVRVLLGKPAAIETIQVPQRSPSGIIRQPTLPVLRPVAQAVSRLGHSSRP